MRHFAAGLTSIGTRTLGADSVRAKIIDAGAQVYIFLGDLDLPVNRGGPTSARQQEVTFGGNKIHWFAFAVPGDQANFNGCRVGPIGFRFNLQVARDNREIHRVAGEWTFQVRITSNGVSPPAVGRKAAPEAYEEFECSRAGCGP